MEEINERKVRASMIYSFIATCKANGVEPREWFEDVIRRIPEYENGRSDVTHLPFLIYGDNCRWISMR